MIYADCYNASAKSVGYAIQYLNEMNSKGKKIAVLGDIAEIDGYELDTYREIAKSISDSDIDILVTYGKDSRMIHHWISKKVQMFHETSQSELIKRIKSFNSKSDCYLFKASRSMHLDVVIQKVFPMAYYKGMFPVAWKYFKWNLRTL